MHKTYRGIIITLAVLNLLIISSCTGSSGDYYVSGEGSTELRWVAPEKNTDDSPLEDLAGYIIYYGPATQNDSAIENLTYSVHVENPNTTTLIVENLRMSTNYMFVMTAVNENRVESYYSNIINKTINQ